MELLITSTLLMLYIGFTGANPCNCDCGLAVPRCLPLPLPCPPPVCAPPPVCPPPIPCPILPLLPALPCPSLCLPPPPMLFADNSCCFGCSAPCTFRSRKRREVSASAFAKAIRNLNDDPVCNNAALKSIIKQNLVDDVWSTKEMVQKAVAAKFPSVQYNVLCAAGDLAYTAHTHDFCFTQLNNNVSCYVFRPLSR